MRLLYSLGIYLASFHVKIISLFNQKLKLGVQGRSQTFGKLQQHINKNDKTLWFHCASLGEYEQGLPVFEGLRGRYPNHKIILSFFSPSGYEIKKEAPIADVVVYLPLDTSANAKRFLDLAHPDFIIFVKYEIWPNFSYEIKRRQLRAILISAAFRKNQSFFKWYGGLMRRSLMAFEYIFAQDELSLELLNSINYDSVTISGDTRLDRVTNQLTADNHVSFIEEFKDSKTCIMFGSTWPEDDLLFMPYINACDNDNLKFLIAPHDIKPNYVGSIKSQIRHKYVSFSDMKGKDLKTPKVFILDTIGYLSRTYSYGDIAYVGGAAGNTGLHNILEPAVFGIPIIIGKNYSKFPEAKLLIEHKGVT
ncbi:MAG: glycosyltransferase N-terminal domain-containing protein, partial [Bacteroidota bacterium]